MYVSNKRECSRTDAAATSIRGVFRFTDHYSVGSEKSWLLSSTSWLNVACDLNNGPQRGVPKYGMSAAYQ